MCWDLGSGLDHGAKSGWKGILRQNEEEQVHKATVPPCFTTLAASTQNLSISNQCAYSYQPIPFPPSQKRVTHSHSTNQQIHAPLLQSLLPRKILQLLSHPNYKLLPPPHKPSTKRIPLHTSILNLLLTRFTPLCVIHATKRIPAKSFSNGAILAIGNGVNDVSRLTMETILPTMTTMIGNPKGAFNLLDVHVLLEVAVLPRGVNPVRPDIPQPCLILLTVV